MCSCVSCWNSAEVAIAVSVNAEVVVVSAGVGVFVNSKVNSKVGVVVIVEKVSVEAVVAFVVRILAKVGIGLDLNAFAEVGLVVGVKASFNVGEPVSAMVSACVGVRVKTKVLAEVGVVAVGEKISTEVEVAFGVEVLVAVRVAEVFLFLCAGFVLGFNIANEDIFPPLSLTISKAGITHLFFSHLTQLSLTSLKWCISEPERKCCSGFDHSPSTSQNSTPLLVSTQHSGTRRKSAIRSKCAWYSLGCFSMKLTVNLVLTFSN